jgi:hypothetical protein
VLPGASTRNDLGSSREIIIKLHDLALPHLRSEDQGRFPPVIAK